VVSQPAPALQSANPPEHVPTTHAPPPEQLADATRGSAEQSTHVPPQWVVSDTCSHPSLRVALQSAKPLLHDA
jgi:hypothetical protein